MSATDHPAERISDSFGQWIRKQWSLAISGLLTLASVYLTFARDWDKLAPSVAFLGRYIDVVIFALQSIVVLVFLFRLAFGAPPLACPHKGERRIAINKAVERFHLAWCWVWGTWAMLYAVLAIKHFMSSSPALLHLDAAIAGPGVAGRMSSLRGFEALLRSAADSLKHSAAALSDTTLTTKGFEGVAYSWRATYHPGSLGSDLVPPALIGAMLNALNNINGLAFLMLYVVLTRRPTRPHQLRRASAFVLFVPVVVILAIAETATPIDPTAPFNWYSVVASVLSAIVLILFLGRLGGQYIRPPAWVSVMLAGYCALQLAWPYFAEHDVAAWMGSFALCLKLLLFFTVQYALYSGDVIYYIDRVMDRGTTISHASGPERALPTLGEEQKRRLIRELLSDDELKEWGTDDGRASALKPIQGT